MRKGKEKPKLVSCSSDEVIAALNKLGNFTTKQKGTSHIKIIHINTNKKSEIPQRTKSKPIKQGLLKAFIKNYLVKELKYTEEEIYKYLWC